MSDHQRSSTIGAGFFFKKANRQRPVSAEAIAYTRKAPGNEALEEWKQAKDHRQKTNEHKSEIDRDEIFDDQISNSKLIVQQKECILYSF